MLEGVEYDLVREFLYNSGINLKESGVLDLFAGDGSFRSHKITREARIVDAVDRSKTKLDTYKKGMTNVVTHPEDAIEFVNKACIANTDFYKWEVILIDNPGRIFGDYCEHFDLFPQVLQLLSQNNPSALVFNVLPNANKRLGSVNKHRGIRKEFYQSSKEYLEEEFLTQFYDGYFFPREIRGRSFFPRTHSQLGGKNQYWIAAYVFEGIKDV